MNKLISELTDTELVILFLTGKITAKKIDDRWYPFIGGYKMAERFSASKRPDAMLLATQYKENVSLEILRVIAAHADVL